MHCSIKRKNCAIRQNTFYVEGTVGGYLKKNYCLWGGQEENVSSKENSPPRRDFINDRSLKWIAEKNAHDQIK